MRGNQSVSARLIICRREGVTADVSGLGELGKAAGVLVTVGGLSSTTRLKSVSNNSRNFSASMSSSTVYLSFSEVGEVRSA